MKTFTEPLKELKEFETLSAGVHDLRGIAQISGCIDAAKPHFMYSVKKQKKLFCVVLHRSHVLLTRQNHLSCIV